ncbi:MAG TPA: PEGA domain-containing protein [Polyangia bacterium]|nr:PEGA domain-containing protein [Polyangia bacterium]
MRSCIRSWASILAIGGPLVLWPANARAEARSADASARPADEHAGAKAEARAHFERGVQLGRDGDYRQAAAAFQRAYELSPHYAVLYNLAEAQVALGQPVEAIDTFQRYLLEGGANVPADRRAEVQASIKQQQARVSMLTVETNVAGASIVVDGVLVGRSPLAGPVRVARGKHQVTATLDGYRAQSQTVVAEEKARVNVQLERGAGAAGAPPPATPASPPAATGPAPPAPGPPVTALPPPQSDPAPLLLQQSPGPDAGAPAHRDVRRTVGFVAGGLGVAMGAAALGCYLWNRSRFDDYEAAKVNDVAKADSIRSVNAVTAGLALGSGALIATGVVLVLTAPPRAAGSAQAGVTAGSAVAVGPRGISWRTTW